MLKEISAYRLIACLASLIIFLLLILFFSPSSVNALPPANFERLSVINSGLNVPTGFEFAPDGRIFIIEQTGAIKIIKNGQLLPRIFDELPSLAESDRGLLGIAFDPDFNTNHYVYFYYMSLESKHMLVRFDASDDIGKNGPVVVWASNVVAGSNHAGGTIQFGPDGKLYISIGDGGNPPNAQDLSNVMGKILRINKDGTIPADNPFVNTPHAKGEIWAYGFRNPFRFQFDKATGNLIEGEVGEAKWEEVNKIVRGGNYGWPLAEGNCASCSFIQPLYTYPHVGPSYSITGGLVYHGSNFPADYAGSYIFGDYAHMFMKRLTFNSDGSVSGVFDFDPDSGTVVDLKVAPDGQFYYLTIFPAGLFRVNYTLGNKTPVVKSAASPASGLPPLAVNFSSSGSKDPEGVALTYLWDFGDGTTSTAPNPAKTYPNVGKYTVNLTVSDGTLSAKAFPLTVSVGTPPSVNFTAPADTSTYKAGDVINYTITARDSTGVDLPAANVTFESVFHHLTHIHPFLRPVNSKSGSFTIPQSGESSASTWYELTARATDSHGLTAAKTINIFPQKIKFTLNTAPANLKIGLDGTPTVTPITIEGVVGFKRQIDALTQQVGGQYLEFDKWSDGGAKRHFFTLPASDTIYTASFKPQPPYTGAYFNNPTFSGAPVFTRTDPIIDFNWDQGSPDARIPNDQFSVRWTKKQFFYFGRYKFFGHSDDGIRVYLDGKLVVDGWAFNQGVSSILDIAEGTHDLRVDYREDGGGANVGFSWDLTPDQPAASATPKPSPKPSPSPLVTPSPQPTIAPTAYKGEYFANQDLSGSPKLTRSDSQINFVWNDGSPDPSLPVDQFSARWTKTADFTAGTYRFTAAADDGVRLFIDNQLVLNHWVDEAVTTYSVDKTLTAGPHKIVLEYYEAFGGAVANFNYQLSPDAFTGEYFANKTLSGPPKITRQDKNINFVWNEGSPDPQIPVDQFSVRWTKNQSFSGGTHAFTLKSDDGIRFWIDNQLIVDDWRDHGMITYTPTVTLSAGMHLVKIEYYENSGGAVAIFNQDN